jgi:hypothetical protein
MEVTELVVKLQKHFNDISGDQTQLFEVDLDKDALWNLYLDSFPAGTNEIYRERREHDCSACRQFVRNFGNAVVIKNNQVITVWDFETNDTMYSPVLKALSNFIKSQAVSDVYVTKFSKIGVEKNYEQSDDGKVIEWRHLFLNLPKKFVDTSTRSEGDIKGSFRDVKNVFKRSLDEISKESIQVVLELIAQGSLYKGEEWKSVLNTFLTLKDAYSNLSSDSERNNYAWEQSVKIGASVGKIRNHSIGTLLTNITEGMDLDLAVKKYESIVAPENYKRPKAIFTQKMLDDAKNTIEQLGYLNSLGRRYATLDDIRVNNILFSNKDASKRIVGASVFDEMATATTKNPKRFDKAEEITIDNFITNVLPTTTSVEVLLDNKHSQNMVSLIAPQDATALSMFKWGNAFSWAYTGNITDSSMKENVKSAGGKVDGDLRFSIQWNDVERDNCDLDAHCVELGKYEIYFGNKRTKSPNGGMLDVDIISPISGKPAVENITYATRRSMQDGVYTFFIHNYSGTTRSGFRAEIEFDGQIYAYDYRGATVSGKTTQVAEVTLKNGLFTIVEKLPSTTSSKSVWGVQTQQFTPVTVMMHSPNYWDEQQGIGHKHYFFMLKDCVNTESPNGFYNEFLKQELDAHKRVFEALGGKMAVKDVPDQLSGVGFSSTKRNELIVKVKGQTERVLKIKF